MQTYSPTTPFGRRSPSLGQIKLRKAAEAVASDAVVHKWRVFNDLREAKVALGLTDRALAILNALLTFHPETTLGAGGDLIVFPSNAQLIARSYGMSPATLRRHLANLVDCGIVLRRDSPNGKRYARKDEDGGIERAFGFDLVPLVARAAEFAAAAETVRAAQRALKRARESFTLQRRDIVKLIALGLEEGVAGDWSELETRYRSLMATLPRQPDLDHLTALDDALAGLRAEIEILMDAHVNSRKSSANESHCERHIQNSNPNLPHESEAVYRQEKKASPSEEMSASPVAVSLTRDRIPLRLVLDACPNIIWVAKGGEIRSWNDLAAAAEAVRPMLGISASAWSEARAILGADHATATLAAIYQRADLIHSAGGYLRSLVQRAGSGQFTAWPMLMALLRSRLDGERQPRSQSQ